MIIGAESSNQGRMNQSIRGLSKCLVLCSVVSALVSGCGSTSGGGAGGGTGGGTGAAGGGGPSCTLATKLTFATTSKILSGVGSATCSAAAEITVKVCLQWKTAADPTFVDVQCQASTVSGQLSNSITTMVQAGLSVHQWRTTVDATIDGKAFAQQTSEEVTAP